MHNELDDCSRHLLKLLETADPDIERRTFPNLRHLIYGAAPMPPEKVRAASTAFSGLRRPSAKREIALWQSEDVQGMISDADKERVRGLIADHVEERALGRE